MGTNAVIPGIKTIVGCWTKILININGNSITVVVSICQISKINNQNLMGENEIIVFSQKILKPSLSIFQLKYELP